MGRYSLILLAAVLMGASGQSLRAEEAVILITQEEASLPPPKGAVSVDRRGITRGPKVELVSAADNPQAPIHFQLKFLSFGGATIDPASVKITYLRTPNVDLTSRVKPFVQPTGIDMPDVSLPAGEYMLRIDVKDSDGRVGGTSFMLKVAH